MRKPGSLLEHRHGYGGLRRLTTRVIIHLQGQAKCRLDVADGGTSQIAARVTDHPLLARCRRASDWASVRADPMIEGKATSQNGSPELWRAVARSAGVGGNGQVLKPPQPGWNEDINMLRPRWTVFA